MVVQAVAAACTGTAMRPVGMPSRIDWTRVQHLAQAHRVMPLLAEGLGTAAPAGVRAELRAEVLQRVQRSLQMSSVLGEVTTTLAAAGIRALAMKGPALGAVAYGQATRRSFLDLDLWVARADLTPAAGLLTKAGWHVDRQLADAVRRPSRFVQATLSAIRDRLEIEIHGEAFARFVDRSFDFERCWTHRREVALGPARVQTPGAADTLHYLCLHGDWHTWERLQWIADVAMAARACDEAAADALVARATRAGHARVVRVALRLATTLVHVTLPAPLDACATADDPRAATLVAQVCRAIATDRAIVGATERFAFHVGSRQRRARRHYLLWCGMTASAADVAEAGLPPRLSWLYPLWRMPGLLRRYGRPTSAPANRA